MQSLSKFQIKKKNLKMHMETKIPGIVKVIIGKKE